nr:EOG090X0F3A [Triops cancriformis]
MIEKSTLSDVQISLERQELQSAANLGVAPADVYAQLLAVYLCKFDLCNAKLLWKRIPADLKTAEPMLNQIWVVGQQLWKKESAETFVALRREWPELIKPFMTLLENLLREKTVDLIGRAYSSIKPEDMGNMVGMSGPQDAIVLAKELGWEHQLESNMIIPKAKLQTAPLAVLAEEQLNRLTQYVSFLEN